MVSVGYPHIPARHGYAGCPASQTQRTAGPTGRTAASKVNALRQLADFAFLTLGGGLKRREMISTRLGDVLSELYFLSATLKRWEDEGRKDADVPLVNFTAKTAFAKIGERLALVLVNLPARWAGWLLRAVTLPG